MCIAGIHFTNLIMKIEKMNSQIYLYLFRYKTNCITIKTSFFRVNISETMIIDNKS